MTHQNSQNSDFEPKVHFKLYKSKKSWLIAGAVFASMSIGAANAETVHADTTDQPSNSRKVATSSALSNSSSVALKSSQSSTSTSSAVASSVATTNSAASDVTSSAAVTNLGNANAAQVKNAKAAATETYQATGQAQKVTATAAVTDISSQVGFVNSSAATSDGAFNGTVTYDDTTNTVNIDLATGYQMTQSQVDAVKAFAHLDDEDPSNDMIITGKSPLISDGKDANGKSIFKSSDPLVFQIEDVQSVGGLPENGSLGLSVTDSWRTTDAKTITNPDSEIWMGLKDPNEGYYITISHGDPTDADKETAIIKGHVGTELNISSNNYMARLTNQQREQFFNMLAVAMASQQDSDPSNDLTVYATSDATGSKWSPVEGLNTTNVSLNVSIIDTEGNVLYTSSKAGTIEFSGSATDNYLTTTTKTPATISDDISAALNALKNCSTYTDSTQTVGDGSTKYKITKTVLGNPSTSNSAVADNNATIDLSKYPNSTISYGDDGKVTASIDFALAKASPTIDITYTVTKDTTATATLSFVDDDKQGQAVGTVTTLTGDAGTTPTNKVQIPANYQVVAGSGYTDNSDQTVSTSTALTADDTDNVVVHLKHKKTTKPAPSSSSDSAYGNTHKSFTITVNQNTPSGTQTVTQTITYSRSYTVDLVTGATVSYGNWQTTNSFKNMTPTAVNGYLPSTSSISTGTKTDGGQTISDMLTAFGNGSATTAQNATITVSYKEQPKTTTPSEPSTPTTTPSQPSTPSKPSTATTTPVVPASKPATIPANHTYVSVPYHPRTISPQYSTVTILYIDGDTGKVLKYEVLTGENGTVINFDTYQFIHDLQLEGYFITSNGTALDHADFGSGGTTFRVYMSRGNHQEQPTTSAPTQAAPAKHKHHHKKTTVKAPKKKMFDHSSDDPIIVDDVDAILGIGYGDNGGGDNEVSELGKFFVSLSGRVNFGVELLKTED
ncbi:mucin-binding protein [Paucilactobacillus sp. N302-9]